MRLDKFELMGMQIIPGRGIVLDVVTKNSPTIGDEIVISDVFYTIIGIEKMTSNPERMGLIVKKEAAIEYEEIKFGNRLVYPGGLEITVLGFKTKPTPLVWDGTQWFELKRCKRLETNP